MSLTLTTWNINSVRLRIDLVEQFVTQYSPDILCLQEIKCTNADFPSKAFSKLGYPYLAVNGQKGYHGVAIISRIPFSDTDQRSFCNKLESRHISVQFSLDSGARQRFRLHNLYVPAGGDEPDIELNPKFAHKIDFYDEMKQWFKEDKSFSSNSILVGDLNVAPLETDVWSHRAMINVVSHTPIEIERFNAAYSAGGWVDVARQHIKPEQKLFTWWSYRSPNWLQSDRGRRLDHVWLSPALAAHSKTIHVLKEARGWTRPSDHVPVTVTLG